MDDAGRAHLNEIVEKTVGAVYEVGRILGAGFLEKVYERALTLELRRRGLRVETQVPVNVRYKGESVGDYFADVVVEGCVIVELKCVKEFGNEHIAQCLNYLRATNLHLALLVNFQNPKIEWRRLVRDF